MFLPRKFRHISEILNDKQYEFCYKPNSHHKVISCKEAAFERGIELSQELKSIVVSIDSELYIIHLRGSQRINENRILNLFNLPYTKKNSLRFAHLYELVNKLETKPGLICPFIQSLWKCRHIISILSSERICT